jgi:cytidylate kinase
MSYASQYGYNTPAQASERDEDLVHKVTMAVIQRAANSGACVIVGRGSQCLLQGRTDVLNVLAYASIKDRLWRLRQRQPRCRDLELQIKHVDSQRSAYVRQHYRRDWLDRSLYDLCINTALGLDLAAELITSTVQKARQPQKKRQSQTPFGQDVPEITDPTAQPTRIEEVRS